MKDVELWHGDCLDLLGRLPDRSVQLFLCDLPYATSIFTSKVKCTKNDWDTEVNLQKLWSRFSRSGRLDTVYAFFCNSRLSSRLILSNASLFRYDLIWSKNRYAGYLDADKMPLRSHESILIFHRGKAVYNPQRVKNQRGGTLVTKGQPIYNQNYKTKREKDNYVAEYGYPRSVLFFDRDHIQDGTGHPTAKPVALLEWIIKTYTHAGDLVVDPTAGSMTTAVAAKKCRRRVVCIEKDEHWYTMGRRRVFQMPPQTE